MTTTIPPRATELECQDTIVDAARRAGWIVHAERPARTGRGWRTAVQGDAGFPDLILARAGRLLALELKRRPNRLTPEQRRWGTELIRAGIDYRTVWVPDEVDDLITELTRRPA